MSFKILNLSFPKIQTQPFNLFLLSSHPITYLDLVTWNLYINV